MRDIDGGSLASGFSLCQVLLRGNVLGKRVKV